MLLRRLIIIAILAFTGITAFGANEAYIGYLYPAGGQRGNIVLIIAGGQFLRGASKVHVSGEGVTGKVVK